MIIIVLVILFVLVLFIPKMRIILKYIPKYITVLPRDIYLYYKHKKYNNAPIGYIAGYVADTGQVFGSGKTLSSVKNLMSIYNRYNNKIVFHNGKFVKQLIYIFANIDINCPQAVKINTLKEYSDFVKTAHDNPDNRIVSYLYIDEAGSQFNSRAFSGNFTPDFISDIVTCRHNWSSFIWTAQDFSLVDKLLRSVTTNIYGCSHFGRIFFNVCYNARQAETVNDLSIVSPDYITGYFATDKLYQMYDTYASFERMRQDLEAGQRLSYDDILSKRDFAHDYNYIKPNHKAKKFFKKLKA